SETIHILVREQCIDFIFSSRRRHTRSKRDWSSDVCSSDLNGNIFAGETDKEDPNTINKSAFFASISARRNVSSGKFSPNNTIPGRIVPPQSHVDVPFK